MKLKYFEEPFTSLKKGEALWNQKLNELSSNYRRDVLENPTPENLFAASAEFEAQSQLMLSEFRYRALELQVETMNRRNWYFLAFLISLAVGLLLIQVVTLCI